MGLVLMTCLQCGAAVVDDSRSVSKGAKDGDGIGQHNAFHGIGGPRGAYDMKRYAFVAVLEEPEA